MRVRLSIISLALLLQCAVACHRKENRGHDGGGRCCGMRTIDATPAYSIDAAVEAAKKRLNESFEAQVKQADDDHARAIAEVSNAPGATTGEQEKVKRALEDMVKGGHSPRGQAIIDGVAAGHQKLDATAAAAAGKSEAEQQAAVEQGEAAAKIEATQKATENTKKADEDLVGGLLKAAAGPAAFAACLALGGGPICGAVAALVSKIFGGSGNIDTQGLTKFINATARIFSGECDLECIQDTISTLDVRPDQVGEIVEKVLTQGKFDPAKAKEIAGQAKDITRRIGLGRKCLEEVIRTTDETEILQRLDQNCAAVIQGLLRYEEEDIKCVLLAAGDRALLAQAAQCLVDRRFGKEAR